MSSTTWDADLETGDATVDEQHRTIFRLFGELEAADDRPEEIIHALDALTEYVQMHFVTEEDLMARVRYPEVAKAEHLGEHHALTETVREKVLQFRTGELTTVGPLCTLLRDWLNEHVDTRDRALVHFVRAAERAEPPLTP